MALQTKLSTHLRRFARSDDGAVAIFFALLLPVTLGSVALVEASKVYGVKNQLQITADAAATAGVLELDPTRKVTTPTEAADTIAEANMPPDGQYGDVLVKPDVVTGIWDGADDVIPDPEPNAVKVTTRANMPLLFAPALRMLPGLGEAPTSFAPEAQAIALLRLDKCYMNGFVAGGVVNMNSSNSFGAGFCVYGRQGVAVNSSNSFAAGSEVGMVDLASLKAGGTNPGLPEALVQKDISAPAPGRATELIDDLLAGNGPMGTPVTVSQLPANPKPGTLYFVTNPIDIKLSGGLLEDIGIISDHSIRIRSNSNLRNVTVASRGSVTIDSNVEIGDADFCSTGDGKSLIISAGGVTGEQVEAGSNIGLHGVQMVSGSAIKMNSNLSITGASMQSVGDISFNSSFDVAVCPDQTSANATGDGTLVSRLVN